MKMLKMFVLPVFFILLTTSVLAQEHYTEGNVRTVSYYRTSPGQFDNYMKYLRTNFLPVQEEAKKQGLIVGYSVLLNVPSSQDDWDVAIVTINKSFGDALDYNQNEADKMKKIQQDHYKTTDENKMDEMTSKRFEMRTYMGTKYFREVTLKPLQ
jgi:adenosine deaminase